MSFAFDPALLDINAFTAYDDGGKNPQKVPGLNRIVQQVRFTQKFILTYHALVVGILLVFSLLHWSRVFKRGVRRTCPSSAKEVDMQPETQRARYAAIVKEAERDGSSSSASSTHDSDEDNFSMHKPVSEQSPLLITSSALSSSTSLRSKIWCRAKALLMYQPAPIPLIKKTLPSNATSIFICGFAAINILYLLYDVTDLKSLFAFSDRAGSLFVANLPLLYLLAAKNQPLKLLTGRSYESLNIFHRRLGEWLCLLALFHSAGMVGVWWVVLRPIGWSLAYYLTRQIILLGLLAFISFEVLYLTSLASFRKRSYELFLVVHVTLQTAALVLLWFHHHRARPYVGIALVIFLVDRIVFRAIVKTSIEDATLTVLDSGTVKLSTLVKFSSRQWFRRFINYQHSWKPTDHIFLTVPSLSRKHWIQAHPFTIASAAPLPGEKEARLDLIIRARDGFSRDLLRYAMLHQNVKARLDGPYGSRHALEMLRDSDVALLVAGGSGIAVVYPLLHALATGAVCRKDEETADTPYMKRRIGLIWIVREQHHQNWLTDGQLCTLSTHGVDVILPQATVEAGRPDMQRMVQNWLTSSMTDNRGAAGVVCCGPDEMSRTVRNSCAALVAQGLPVDVMIEKFGW